MDVFDWFRRISPPTVMIVPSLNTPESPVMFTVSMLITIFVSRPLFVVLCNLSANQNDVFFQTSFLGVGTAV